ncbi:hypothetical protein ACHAPJ_005892 [Fusarium lateritium]
MTWNPIELPTGALKLLAGPNVHGKDPFASEVANADVSDPVSSLARALPKIRRMCLDVDWAKVIRVRNRKAIDKSGLKPEAVQLIIRLVNAHIPIEGNGTIGSKLEDFWKQPPLEIGNPASPYATFLKDTRNGHMDLTYDNVDMSDIVRPAEPVPATNIFHNGAHRTVTHIVGAVDEVTMLDEQCMALRDTTSQAVVIEDVFGKRMPSSDDLVNHGTVADGSSLHQYFCVPMIEGLTSPEIDEKRT